MARMSVEERFFAKVDKSSECWLWTGSTRGRGYGRFRAAGGEMQSTHRFAYALAYGPIPDGMDIDHICHTRACVNPKHLRTVTHKQNLENLSGVRKNNTSGVRGVYWSSKNGKWTAQVRHNYQRIHVGSFANLADAEAAVTAKRNELYTHNDIDRVAA